jgi:hypothetical protein
MCCMKIVKFLIVYLLYPRVACSKIYNKQFFTVSIN